jgi:Zn-dependent protease
VIFLLREPVQLLAVAIGLVIGVVLHNVAQSVAARATGDPAARLARGMTLDPRRHLEPFGVIAMVVTALGWGRPVELTEPRRQGGRRGRFIATVLAGPAATLIVGAPLVAGAAVASPDRRFLVDTGPTSAALKVMFFVGLVLVEMSVLQLVPLPPLDGARIMWVLAPPSPGWQKARYYLEEENYGLGILLLLMLPIFGGVGLIVRIVLAVAQPIIDALVGS